MSEQKEDKKKVLVRKGEDQEIDLLLNKFDDLREIKLGIASQIESHRETIKKLEPLVRKGDEIKKEEGEIWDKLEALLVSKSYTKEEFVPLGYDHEKKELYIRELSREELNSRLMAELVGRFKEHIEGESAS